MKKLLALSCIFTLALATPYAPLLGMEQQQEVEAEAAECSICTDSLNNGKKVTTLKCSQATPHRFHFDCLKTWCITQRTITATCPFCRATVKYNDVFGKDASTTVKVLISSQCFISNFIDAVIGYIKSDIKYDNSDDHFWQRLIIQVVNELLLSPQISVVASPPPLSSRLAPLCGPISGILAVVNAHVAREAINYKIFSMMGYSTNFTQRITRLLAYEAAAYATQKPYSHFKKVANTVYGLDLDTEFLAKLDGFASNLPISKKFLEYSGTAAGFIFARHFNAELQRGLQYITHIIEEQISGFADNA